MADSGRVAANGKNWHFFAKKTGNFLGFLLKMLYLCMQKSYVFSHSILCIHAVKTMFSLGQSYALTLLKRNFDAADVGLCDRLCGTL